MTAVIEDELEESEPLRRLNRDLLDAAALLSPAEIRYIVDGYYGLQEYRKASNNQIRSLDEGEPSRLLYWLAGNTEQTEGQIKRAMQAWCEGPRGGKPAAWALSQKGIGPVLCAGLLSHIDITKAPTVGHIWRFAGLDPTLKWERSQKRPYNATLKTLCWKIGDSFVKVSNRSSAYGELYKARKLQEIERNDAGDFADQARATLEAKPNHAQAAIYKTGKLPAGRLDLRARRYAVKLFLAHLHHVLYEDRYGEPPPKPYIFEHAVGHIHYLAPPGWPLS